MFVAWWTGESRVPHDGVELSLLVGCCSYLISLPRMALAGSDFGRIPPRHRIENETCRKKEDVSPYALLGDGMEKSAGIGCSQI